MTPVRSDHALITSENHIQVYCSLSSIEIPSKDSSVAFCSGDTVHVSTFSPDDSHIRQRCAIVIESM